MKSHSPLPDSAEQLIVRLTTIFPDFRYKADVFGDAQAPTFHSVLIAFASFFKAVAASSRQLRALGELVNAATEGGGALENAFGTCFLEHLRQIKAPAALRPYLSPKARTLMRA